MHPTLLQSSAWRRRSARRTIRRARSHVYAVPTTRPAFAQVEHLGQTLLPLPYAQLNRLVAVVFLVLLPFGTANSLGHFTVVFCFVVNTIYFTLDACAAIMETPFGTDISQVGPLYSPSRRI